MQNYRYNISSRLGSGPSILGALVLVAVAILSFSGSLAREVFADPNTGAIWTTNASGSEVNQNIYTSKQLVYLNGGPNSNGNGGTGLEDGAYYVKVTEPEGAFLGSSGNSTVPVVNGVFSLINLYQLTHFADTTNPGGMYKVWVSKNIDFPGGEFKTDNFKVVADSTPTPTPTPTPTATPTATPTEEPSPTPTDPGETESPTPTPTPTGTAQPTATPTPTDSGTGGGSTTTSNSNESSNSSVQGQVLGATTLAATGSFEESLYSLSFVTGLIFLGLGIMKYARLQK